MTAPQPSILLSAAAPARSDRAVVFAADGRYARCAQLAARRIAALHPDRDFDICLCSDADPAVPESLAADGVRACRVTTGGLFAGLRLDAGRTDVVYLRLALPAALAADYRRILYLDADVFVQGGDFGRLLGVGLRGHAVGAVRDNMQWRTPGRRPAQFRALGLPAVPYFNAGVLLIDVAAWNAAGIMERCIDFGTRHREKMIRHDQNLLNGTLLGDWAELSPLWNWQYTRSSLLFEAMEDAHLVHFIGPKKPWSHRGGALPRRFRRAFRAFEAEHFPEVPQIGEDGEPPHRNREFLRGALLKHLLGMGATCRYLERFPDDLTVIPHGKPG